MKLSIPLLVLAISISDVCSAAPQTHDECRASQLQSEIVSCIERNLYDPCDDAGSSWGRAQCGWAWAEVAERRIAKAEMAILSNLRKNPRTRNAIQLFEKSKIDWRNYRTSHCRFTNLTVDLAGFNETSFTHAAFCYRRITEQRATELEEITSKHE